MPHVPELIRKHTINAASRQCRSSDVQHERLPISNDVGVRTHIADDAVWLAYAINKYYTIMNDVGILDENLTFLTESKLTSSIGNAFCNTSVLNGIVSLYEHAAIAWDIVINVLTPMGCHSC